MAPDEERGEAVLLTDDPSFFALWSASAVPTYTLRILPFASTSAQMGPEKLGNASVILVDLGEARPSDRLHHLVTQQPGAPPRIWANIADARYFQDPVERAACRHRDFYWVARDKSPTHFLIGLETLFKCARARATSDRRLTNAVRGSVEAMVAALASLSPEAHGHAVRVAALAEALAVGLGVRTLWPVRLTGLLFNLGAIALEHDTFHRALVGTVLSATERLHVDQMPTLTLRLLDPIGHIEPVKAMLRQLFERGPELDVSQARGLLREAACAHASNAARDLDVGAQAVGIAKDYDVMVSRGVSHEEALKLARLRPGAYATIVVTTLGTHIEAESSKRHLAVVDLAEVPLFATLIDDVRMPNGTLLVSRGHVVDLWLKERLTQFAEHAPGHQVNVSLHS